MSTHAIGVDEMPTSPGDPPEYTQQDPNAQDTPLTLLGPSEPVVLTWTLPPAPAVQAPVVQAPVNPPEYAPTTPITYTFSPTSSNAMLLLPSPDAPETRPRYHISVSMNPFMPEYTTTCVCRGGTPDGEVVGDFRCIPLIAASVYPSTVFIRGQEHYLEKVMLLTKRRTAYNQRHWIWNAMDNARSCSWDCGKWPFGPFVCHSRSRLDVIYAKFTPARTLRQPGYAPELSMLEVMPAGQRLFDDIVMSVLIIERRRLSMDV